MNDKKEKLYWRRLDNSAKIFPISAGKRYSTVFRLSVVLKEAIQPDILQIALEKALEEYEFFRVRLKSGFFLKYF